MVVLQDANADPLERRQPAEFRKVYVVEVFHTHRTFVRPVGALAADFNPDSRPLQLCDGFVGEAPAFFAPETDAYGELFEVVIPCPLRKRREQEMHVTFPGHPFRQLDRLPAGGSRPAVQRREVGAVDPADHAAPRVRVDGLVEMQARNRLRDERAGYALALQRHAGHVEEVVKVVVRPAEPTVGRPDVGREPVVERVGVADSAAAPLAYPPFAGEPVVVAVAVYGAPAVETLLRADADQAARACRPVAGVEPLGKAILEFVVPHVVPEEREVAVREAARRNLTHPQLPLGLFPRPPVLLEHRGAGQHLERHADPVDVEYVGVRGQRPVDIVDRVAVLYLVVHVEYPDAAFQMVSPYVVDAQVEQHAAVLAAREGDIDVVEELEDGFQPLLCPLVDIHGCGRLLSYCIATYCFHSRIAANPSVRNISAWRISVTERIV